MLVSHDFPSIVDRLNQVVLITGTGLSTPDCPTLGDLKTDLDNIIMGLGLEPNGDEYDKAEAVLIKLNEDGKTDSESRLWLAEKLGMLDDRRWFGEVGLPLSGNTPRHRVIARFVVEDRLSGIVNLNWDALLEAALDSVGLSETGNLHRPWKITKYARVVDKSHLPKLAPANVFPVIKPHGCVRDLEFLRKQYLTGNTNGSVTFKFTASDLAKLTKDQSNAVNNNVKGFIAKYPLIGIGWSASEDYLRTAIIEIAQEIPRPEPDSFKMIDRMWNERHSDIATAYNRGKEESFVEVSIGASPSTDSLMQWLQARHALNHLIIMTPTSEQGPLVEISQELEKCDFDHPILGWADFWLPSWVRVCWRAGAMQGYNQSDNTPIGPLEIPVIPRDAHIPLTGMTNKRRDLHAAARLLCALSKRLNQFRFDLYPGGMLDIDRNCLYIPLPGWKEDVPSSDLAALKPLVKALGSLGYVRKIFLVWLNDESEYIDSTLKQQLEAQFRMLMPLTCFAISNAVSWIDLDELNGD